MKPALSTGSSLSTQLLTICPTMELNKLLLLILILPTTTSASSFFSCDPFFFTRIRTLIFGGYLLVSLILAIDCPDLGFFLFDVASDVFNGMIFINDYKLAWGWTVVGIIFLPMSLVYALSALFLLFDSPSYCKTLLILILAPVLAPVAIPTMTVAYIIFVAYVFARKCVQPGYTPDDFNNGHSAGFFKLLEALLEASFQAVLGLFSSQSLENCFHLIVRLPIGNLICSDLHHPGVRPLRQPHFPLHADCGHLFQCSDHGQGLHRMAPLYKL